MAFLISCSGDKSCFSREDAKKSSIDDLDGFPDLLQARIELIEKLNVKLNWSETLPAYRLYSGKLYKKVKEENWEKPQADIIIVSALFGLIKHYELIPYYNVVITDKIPGSNDNISSYWRNKNLNTYLNKGEGCRSSIY